MNWQRNPVLISLGEGFTPSSISHHIVIAEDIGGILLFFSLELAIYRVPLFVQKRRI